MERVPPRTGFLGAALAAAAFGLTLAPAAGASTVGVDFNSFIAFEAGAGEANQVTVSPGPNGGVLIADAGATLRAGPRCQASGSQVRCPKSKRFLADTKDGDDRVTVDASIQTEVKLGPGNDTYLGGPLSDSALGDDGTDNLDGRGGPDGRGTGAGQQSFTGGPGADIVAGGAGKDQPEGGQGDDMVSGGDDDDLLESGPGADSLAGGLGIDTVSYELAHITCIPSCERDFEVTADLDGEADDGPPGEGDRIATDVENLTGGVAEDHLTGNDGPNHLDDGDQDDCDFDQDTGEPQCSGPRSVDLLEGAGGNDVLDGGGSGRDRLFGGEGDDVLNGQEYGDEAGSGHARDALNCGNGNDRAFTGIDTRKLVSTYDKGGDTVNADCERRIVPGPGRVAALAAPRAALLKAGFLRVAVRCPRDPTRFHDEGCGAELMITTLARRGRITIAGSSLTGVDGGKTQSIAVRVRPKGRPVAKVGRRVRVLINAGKIPTQRATYFIRAG